MKLAAYMLLGGTLIACITSCGALETRKVSEADHAKLERNMRVLLCGRALIREKAVATKKIAESPLFDDRRRDARMIMEIAERIEKEGC